MRLLPAGAEQVDDRVAARDEQLCDQPPVAPPPDRLGAHEARARPRQLRRERRLPRRGSHARGVAAEGREANAGEALFAGLAAPPATELERVAVRDTRACECLGERRLVELRIPA